MKRILITGATIAATVIGVAAFAVAAPFSPVEKAKKPIVANADAQYGTPTPPVPPKPNLIVATAPTIANSISKGVVLTLPIKEAGVKIAAKVTIPAKLAKALGLKVPKGAKTVVIGTASGTTKAAGKFKVTLKLNAKAKAAIKKHAAMKGKQKVATTVAFTFSKGGKTSKAKKPLTIKE